ncbi:hypothetical protein RR48_02244 [Papilio machaon]|uniref:Uncharacterized protein n=1 Tax=Papilio machaon TaxID=76193 RepID=A0A0N0PC92_PAPMA|nr:hypothetical protein RR48_02244 [Papilio machaon]
MENCDKTSIKEDSDKKRPKRSPNIATNTSKNKLLVKSRRHKIPYKSNKIDYSKLYFGPQRRDNSEEDSVEGNPEEGNESLNKEVEEINISIERNMGDGDEEMMSLEVMEEKDEIQSSEEPESNAGFDDQDPKIEDVHIQYLPPKFGQAMGTSIEVEDRNKEIEPQNAKIDSSTEELDKVSVRGEKLDTPDSKLELVSRRPCILSAPFLPGMKTKGRQKDPNDEDVVLKYIRCREIGDTTDINTQETQNSDCPTECPARDVMVCARCKAGVYRTFLSVCHLRLFTCNHPEEKLELVSRRPCILSAPFLPGMKTKGRQKDPNDEDVVLKYIRCREIGDTNDPKCKFAKVDSKDS